MRILIAGASGFVGSSLVEYLMLKGYSDIAILSTNKGKARDQIDYPVKVFGWNPKEGYLEDGAFNGVEVVVNLAGAGIADRRWSKSRKKEIIDSRVMSVECLWRGIDQGGPDVRRFIGVSAVGFFGDRGSEELDENSKKGKGFLSEVCEQWENAFWKNKVDRVKGQVLRFGLVLGRNGGALPKMLQPFIFGLGGRLGTGEQYMSWIHIEDLVRQIEFLIEGKGSEDIYAAVGPCPVTNRAFTKTLSKALRVPAPFCVPKMALKIALGEMSSLLLYSQRVLPRNFEKENFKFIFPDLSDALKDLLKPEIIGFSSFEAVQWIERPKDEVFSFFSEADNLEKITPPHLKFKILNKSTIDIQSGTEIDYGLKLYGVPFRWKTLISRFEENNLFVDEQVKGPYKSWHHEHGFKDVAGGTLITDKVSYKLPMGKLGHLVAGNFVRSDVKKIFEYRKTMVKKLLVGEKM